MRTCAWGRFLWAMIFLVAAGSRSLLGQGLDVGFISRALPMPAFVSPEPARYNLKFGRLTARVRAAMQFEVSDNINLAATHPIADLAFNPHGEVGFVFPINDAQLLELNVGLGYRWYLNNPSVNTSFIDIDPKTRVDYRIKLLHPIEARLYDSVSVVSDPASRPDISGAVGKLINFHLLNNTAGILFNWQPNSEWRFAGGYSYGVTRSLTSDFDTLDLDTHTLSGGAFYTVSPRLTVGLNASYAWMLFSTNFQSDAQSYTIGPMMVFRPTDVITVNGTVGYSTMSFAGNGSVPDTSQPGGGISSLLSIQHKINRYFSHDLNFSSGLLLGVGNNFNRTFAAQYGVSARFSDGLTLRSSFTYDTVDSSGPQGEYAHRFLLYLGTGCQITRLWSMEVGYSFALRDSTVSDRDYSQNRLTLDITREF